MKTFQRYLSSINKGSIVEVLDLPAAVLDHLLAKFFLDIGKRMAAIMNEPDTLSGLQRSIHERFLSEGRSPFTIQKEIGDTRAVQQSTATNSLAVTQASNIFKDHEIKQPSGFPVWTFAASLHERQFKIFNGPVITIQEPRKR